jgi:hypothetical protein
VNADSLPIRSGNGAISFRLDKQVQITNSPPLPWLHLRDAIFTVEAFNWADILQLMNTRGGKM